jgi:alpha-2-macroglobulin
MGKRKEPTMGKKSASLFFAGLVIFSLTLAGCRKGREEGRPPEGQRAASGKGDLHVLSATPSGRTSSPGEADSVVVMFDRPMAVLEALPEGKGKAVLRFVPPVTGKTRWLGSRTLAFTPDKRFPYATEFRVTVPAGTRALDGSYLEKDHSWSFQTIAPVLVRHFPQDKQKWLALDTQLLLVFNQAVDREAAQGFISLVSADEQGKEKKHDFRLSIPSPEKLKQENLDVPPDQALLVEPREPLSPGSTYLVEVKPGLPSKEGQLGMEKSARFSFETFQPFRFVGLDETVRISPSSQLQFRFTNQVEYKSLIQHLRFEPAVEIPEYYSEWEYSNDVLYLSLPLEPETPYKARIDAQLGDDFGNRLGREAVVEFSTGSYPASVSMTTGFGILEAYGDLKYPLSVMNTDRVFFQAARLSKSDIIPLLVQPKIFWADQRFTGRPGFFQVEKSLDLKVPRNKRQVVPLDLSELLAEKTGFVFLQLDTRRTDESSERYLKVFLQSTELGISAKFSPENNIFWVTELQTGLPVPGADVEVRDELNRIKWKGQTDQDGKAVGPGWKEMGLQGKEAWEEPRQWVFATRGRDVAFSSSEWGTGIDPYRFGISYDWSPQPPLIQGSVFTERGIYRAGEEVHIKGILRKKDKGGWIVPASAGVECEIQNPLQETVFKEKVALDDFGSFALDFDSSEESSLGSYQITALIPPEKPGDPAFPVYGSFRVEAFRPAEFEVHVKAENDSTVFGRDYSAEVRANYLFGGVMAGQPVSWRLRLNRTSYSPPGFNGYIFGNELDWGEEETEETSRLAASGEASLDPEGKLRIQLPIQAVKEKDSVAAVLEATVVNPSRRSISSRIQTLVHRGEYYIGLRPSTTFLKKGETLSFDVIAADPRGVLLPDKKIGLKLMRREWRSVRQAGIGGRFRWLTEKEDIEAAAQDIRTKGEPVKVTFSPDKTGYYFLLAAGSDSLGNRITTTTFFYVTGSDYVPWERRDDDSIELVADAPNYAPGQNARILVKSPYERAKALVTVERELVLESRIVDITGTSSQIEIPILSEYIPNVFVSVLLVQGRKSGAAAEENQDLGKPSFKIGAINLSVDPAEKRLAVEILKSKEEYKPGEEVDLKLNVRDGRGAGRPASVAVAVVDLGVLNLIGYQTPDPFSEFYGERPLSVRTSETRIHVVGRRDYGEKGEEAAGGAGESLAAPLGSALAEVELRGDFRSTAYWNASVVADENGEARVSFRLPDNLTTFRVMAVAQTKDSLFGRNESTFRVSKKLLLQAALPRFARVGDAFEGGVLIHNFSPAQGVVTLGVRASGIRLNDPQPERRLTLAPGQSQEVLYAFAADAPGPATFSFRARMGEETDGLEVGLPVRLPRPTETVALSGETGDAADEKIRVPDGIFTEESSIEVQASSSALLGLKGSLSDLDGYPYLCLEQRLSALLPYLLAPRVLLDFGITTLRPEELRKKVDDGLEEVYSYQNDSGGFGLWPESSNDQPFLSCYAALAMLKAAEAGFDIANERLDRALSYLGQFLRQPWKPERGPFAEEDWKTTRAFAVYVLALAKRAQPAFAEGLFAQRETLPLFGQALLLKALFYGKGSPAAQDTLFQEMLNKIKVTPTSAHFEEESSGGWVYSSNTRTTAFILQTLIETGRDHPSLPAIARWLVEKQRAGAPLSTQENLFVFYALNDFYRRYEEPGAEFRGKIILAGKTLLESGFGGSRREVKRAGLKFSELGQGTGKDLALHVEKSGPGRIYYGARMTYAPRQALSARDEGLAVVKRMESVDGKPLEVVPPGSLVVVTIEVAVPQECLFVVVDDPLPAGLEAVNPEFQTESAESLLVLEEEGPAYLEMWWRGFNHIEMRDDRVLLFADSLPAGVHTHRYLARAVSFGRFLMPGTQAGGMYSPEVFGRSPEKVIQVGRPK